MSEMKNKVRVLEHQSQQLKEEVAAREAAVVKEHLEVIRLEKERDSLLAEIQMLKRQLREYEQVRRRARRCTKRGWGECTTGGGRGCQRSTGSVSIAKGVSV